MGVTELEIARSHISALPPPPAVARLVASLDAPDPKPALLAELGFDASGARALASLSDSDATTSTVEMIERLQRSAVSAILLQRTFRHFLMLAFRRECNLNQQCELIRHSLAVGILAESIARVSPELGVAPETAFLAGALHDLGKFALAVVYPRSFERLVSARRAAEQAGRLETRHLGVDHSVAGAWVAEAWSLPAGVCDAIRLHHLPGDPALASPDHHALVAVVRAANAVVRSSESGSAGLSGGDEVDACCTAIRLRRPDVEKELEGLNAQVMRWQSALGFSPMPTTATVLDWAIEAAVRGGRGAADTTVETSASAPLAAAICCFESRINVRGGLAAMASLALESAEHVRPNDIRAVFATGGGVVAAAFRESTGRHTNSVFPATDEWRRWLDSTRSRAPLDGRGRQLIAAAGMKIDDREALEFVPLSRAGRQHGGFLIAVRGGSAATSADDACAEAFLARVATAVADFESHAQAQRLADDLMETNRRLQRAQGEILRSRALSMIAELAGGAGHELNNPLSVISGRAELLLRDADPDSEAHRALLQIQAKAHDCSRIVSQLMDFAIPRAPVFTECSPGQILETIRAMWRDRSLPAGIRIEFELDRTAQAADRRARADAAQLATAAGELIQNAIDAMHDRPGTVRVLVRMANQSAVGGEPAPVGANAFEIVVTDSGCGMSASVLQRAFDPFFSHRVAGRSRGLGLPRAFRVVESHGGRIWLDSRPGEGTQAFIQIPLVE